MADQVQPPDHWQFRSIPEDVCITLRNLMFSANEKYEAHNATQFGS
jgi:hypothetical protein